MQEELRALQKNDIWELVPLLVGKQALDANRCTDFKREYG